MYEYAKVDVLCEDNGTVIPSDVVNYKQNSYLTVDVGGKHYTTENGLLNGSMSKPLDHC